MRFAAGARAASSWQKVKTLDLSATFSRVLCYGNRTFREAGDWIDLCSQARDGGRTREGEGKAYEPSRAGDERLTRFVRTPATRIIDVP